MSGQNQMKEGLAAFLPKPWDHTAGSPLVPVSIEGPSIHSPWLSTGTSQDPFLEKYTACTHTKESSQEGSTSGWQAGEDRIAQLGVGNIWSGG